MTMALLTNRIPYATMMTCLMIDSMVRIAYSDDKPTVDLLPRTILVRSQEIYDSLTSYSDTGKIVIFDGLKPPPKGNFFFAFKIKLARPNLYQIEWEIEGTGNTRVVWSAGKGDFRGIGNESIKEKNRRSVLLGAIGDSGGATQTIPGVFFKTDWGTLLEAFGDNVKREADEKLDDIDCYALLSEDGKLKITLWIGKKDFLIHQIRHVITDEIITTATETHSDIVVNQKFLPKDFTP